jgi:hypothetical protein
VPHHAEDMADAPVHQALRHEVGDREDMGTPGGNGIGDGEKLARRRR